jgi:hypothetical protein
MQKSKQKEDSFMPNMGAQIAKSIVLAFLLGFRI